MVQTLVDRVGLRFEVWASAQGRFRLRLPSRTPLGELASLGAVSVDNAEIAAGTEVTTIDTSTQTTPPPADGAEPGETYPTNRNSPPRNICRPTDT